MHRRLVRAAVRVAVVTATALGAAACGSDSTSPTPATVRNTTFASSLGVDLANSDSLPSGVFFRDKVVGGGHQVAVGDSLFVHYTGWLSNGTQFDTNVGQAASLAFRVGAGRLISGFDAGVVGMHVGGTRQIVIPPSEGYGSRNYGPIPGNSVIVFDVIADSVHAP